MHVSPREFSRVISHGASFRFFLVKGRNYCGNWRMTDRSVGGSEPRSHADCATDRVRVRGKVGGSLGGREGEEVLRHNAMPGLKLKHDAKVFKFTEWTKKRWTDKGAHTLLGGTVISEQLPNLLLKITYRTDHYYAVLEKQIAFLRHI